ncbi:MAG: PDZ domain-containing protein, partial [Bacteroidia bacterium]
MKAKIWVSALSLVGLFGFSAYKINTTDDRSELVMRLLMESTKVYHYAPLKIDDKFSEEVYDLYLKRIDPNKRYLTKGDIEDLNGYKRKLDDEINVSSYKFFERSEEILSRRVEQIQEFSKEILGSSFDFNKEENIMLKPEEMDYPKDKDELKKRCYQILKYQTLQRYSDMLDDQDKALARKDTAFKQKTESEMEAEARAKVLKLQNEGHQRWLKVTTEERRSVYLNTIVNIYDPHSTYFPPDDKQDFDIRMSGKLEGIGATLQEKEGFIKITSIVPGSPSQRQGDLKEGDAIIKVAQGAGEPVDIEGWRTNDAIKLIRGKKGTEVRLTVKKPDGSTKVIP